MDVFDRFELEGDRLSISLPTQKAIVDLEEESVQVFPRFGDVGEFLCETEGGRHRLYRVAASSNPRHFSYYVTDVGSGESHYLWHWRRSPWNDTLEYTAAGNLLYSYPEHLFYDPATGEALDLTLDWGDDTAYGDYWCWGLVYLPALDGYTVLRFTGERDPEQPVYALTDADEITVELYNRDGVLLRSWDTGLYLPPDAAVQGQMTSFPLEALDSGRIRFTAYHFTEPLRIDTDRTPFLHVYDLDLGDFTWLARKGYAWGEDGEYVLTAQYHTPNTINLDLREVAHVTLYLYRGTSLLHSWEANRPFPQWDARPYSLEYRRWDHQAVFVHRQDPEQSIRIPLDGGDYLELGERKSSSW